MNRERLVILGIMILAAGLRFYQLGRNPPSLYWDETSLGYNAYAVLSTGYDEHGELLPLDRFIAFGDYKPPGYIYALVPAIFIFGVNEFAVRFPSAAAGVVMVVITYLLARKLTNSQHGGITAAFLLAVSPWSLQLSRAAFEAHLAALFNLLGIYLFLIGLKKLRLIPVSFLMFVLSFYTFNANRILTPLVLLFLSLIYAREVWHAKKWIVISVLLTAFLLLPSISYLQSRESRLRFQEVTIFTSLNTVKKANERIARMGNTWWARIIHNRRVYFAREFMNHYLDHFKGEFLFIKGDRNPRLSTQDIGELYLFELPLLVVGVISVIRRRDKVTALLFGWLFIAPIPAGMARETPHMLRVASMLPTFQIFSAVGAINIWNWLKNQTVAVQLPVMGLFTFGVVGGLLLYFHNYWVHYPRDWSGEWQYGYKQMVGKVRELESDYDRVSVTQNLGRPYTYFLFYNQVDPLEYVRIRNAERDWYGLWNVYGFGKYDFTESPRGEEERVLGVKSSGSFPPERKIDEVRRLDGSVVFEIGEL